MTKTVTVRVERTMRHPRLWESDTPVSKKYYAHDEEFQVNLQEGDTVTIVETSPMSKLKRWRVVRSDNFLRVKCEMRTMIQQETQLKVADNSGAEES